jgi:hypothetical protein
MSRALSEKEISGGVVHDLPADLKKALTSDAKALERGRTLRRSREMNGSAGSSRPKNQKQEVAGSNGAVPALRTESEDPVVGLAVRIVESVLGARSGHLSANGTKQTNILRRLTSATDPIKDSMVLVSCPLS